MQALLKWILTFLLDYLWAKLLPVAKKTIEKVKRKVPQEEATKKLEEANEKGASVEEKEKLEKDFLNS